RCRPRPSARPSIVLPAVPTNRPRAALLQRRSRSHDEGGSPLTSQHLETRMARRLVHPLVAQVLLLLPLAMPVSAQATGGRLTGIVRDAGSGLPVSGVEVRVENTQYTSVPQENGRFLILNVAPGIYRVTATRIGYAASSRDNVRVTAGETAMVDIDLRDQVLTIEEIVVTGVVDPISGVKVPFTVGRVTSEDLPIPPNTSAAGAIQGKIAGAQIIRASSPGSGSYIQLRTPTSLYGSN